MEPERWRRVEQLYHSALKIPAEQRGSFVEEQCQGDEDLEEVSNCRTILTAWDGSRFCGRALFATALPFPRPRLELHARISFGRGLQSRCGECHSHCGGIVRVH